MPLSAFIRNVKSEYDWAWMDIKCRYRRSVIGPFWETINVFVLIIGISYISAAIFNNKPMSNIPYVGIGLIVWTLITSIVSESTGLFVAHRDYIRNSALSIDLYIGRTVFKSCITFLHNMLLYVVGVVVLSIPVTPTIFLAIFGLFLLIINSFWVVPVIGFICARFRDLEMIVKNVLQLAFFATPIFWDYKTISPDRSFIVEYNPFYYFLEAVRAPLLGEMLPCRHYMVIGCITLAGYMLLGFIYWRMRRNLAFYV